MKKVKLSILLAVAIPALGACQASTYPEFTPDGQYKVGILLPVSHSALENAASGFVMGLAEKGWTAGNNLTVIIQNAGGNASDQKTMAKALINDCDLSLGLGTGASQSLKSAQYNKGSKKPILFTAVTDPVDAQLVESLAEPGGFVTGTSDAQPVEAQIDMIFDIKPDADKIGILYTASEDNSAVQARQAKAAIEEAGATCYIETATNATDISLAAANLAAKDGIDAIYIPTDNNVAAHMGYVKDAVSGKGILTVCGEEGMLSGGQVTLSINYFNLGKQTGYMAASILNGEKKPADIPVLTMTKEDCEYVYSSSNLSDAGVTLPDTLDISFWRDINA